MIHGTNGIFIYVHLLHVYGQCRQIYMDVLGYVPEISGGVFHLSCFCCFLCWEFFNAPPPKKKKKLKTVPIKEGV